MASEMNTTAATASLTRPKRERRQVHRFKIVEEVTEFHIPEGKGQKLSEIPNVSYCIRKQRVRSDPGIVALHKLIFGVGKRAEYKQHLLDFSGFVYDEKTTRDKIVAKANKMHLPLLKEVLLILDQPRSGTKEQIVERLLTFLENPQPSGNPSIEAREEQKRASRKRKKERKEKRASKRSKKSSSKSSSSKKKPGKVSKRKKEEAASSDAEEDEEPLDPELGKLFHSLNSVLKDADFANLTMGEVKRQLRESCGEELVKKHQNWIREKVKERVTQSSSS